MLRGQLVLAVISGILLTLAFPKVDLGWIAWVALVPLFLALRQVRPLAGAIIGLTAGLVHYLGLMYWTAYTMNIYGFVPLVFSVLGLLVLALAMALYMALITFLVSLLTRKPLQLLITAPFVWVVVEWLRTWLFTGFPWELLGHSQYNHLWIIQICDLFGVFGVSALIVFCNAVITLAVLHWIDKPWQDQRVNRRPVVRAGIWMAAMFVVTLAYGIYRIHANDRLTREQPHVPIAVIQGNIDQSHKWDPSFQMLTTAKYKNLSLAAAKKGADLIIWPETATPFYLFYENLLTEMVVNGIKQANAYFIIGSPAADIKGSEYKYYNSAYLMSPEGKMIGKYDKVHLVPFGEYVPMQRWLPFIHKLVEQVGDFTAGAQGQTLDWNRHPIGMLICYEAIFSHLARSMVDNGAQLLVNITNDAWFGRTSAAYQHLSMAVFRCVETRRYMARAANTGISAFIDPSGRILGTTQLYEDDFLLGRVAFLDEQTFYSRWGDWPLVTVSWALLLAMMFKYRLASRSRLKVGPSVK